MVETAMHLRPSDVAPVVIDITSPIINERIFFTRPSYLIYSSLFHHNKVATNRVMRKEIIINLTK